MTSLKNPLILFLALAFVALAASAIAEVPQLINYQGRLTDNSGDPVANGDYDITFTIWNWESGGTLLWNSGPQTITVTGGLFSYKLGSAVSLPHSLFTDTTRWLEITVETDPPISPRTKFITAPYAYHSLRSDTAAYAFSGAGGDGDITAVYASTGLDGGGETGDVTLSIADGGVSGLQIASAAISAGKIQENAVWSDHILDGTITASDIDNTSVQQRVTGTAAPGNYITAINADGSVATAVDENSGGDITAVNAGYGLMGGGTNGDITIDVEVGVGLSKGDDFIYVTPNGVHADRITDGTITVADIDNTSVQQRVTGVATPGNYITAVNADGSVVTAVDQTGTRKMCGDMYEGMTNSSSQITITFPVTFTAAPYFSVTGYIKSGGQAGKMAHVVVSSLTTTSAVVTIEYWTGALHNGVGDSVEMLLAYTAMEK